MGMLLSTLLSAHKAVSTYFYDYVATETEYRVLVISVVICGHTEQGNVRWH
jgi:hypothetical protein